jgi:NAD(P)-dependent dehydrogenase (short-subunit alcohol dehydrogenase family)
MGGDVGRLEGKVALISGGARGQGASHAEVFAREGAQVVIGDVRSQQGAAVAERLAGDGLPVRFTNLDVTREEDWLSAVALAEAEFGLLNVLVNNAGVLGSMKDLTDETLEEWHAALAVNQTGVFLGMKHAIPSMRRAGGGAIVNIASIWGIVGGERYFSYQASKGAVQMMTRAAALAYVGDNVRVNSVCPGLVMTPMAEEEGEESNEAVRSATPMGRGCSAEEISWGVLYLASDEACYVTGTDLVIDGGYCAR